MYRCTIFFPERRKHDSQRIDVSSTTTTSTFLWAGGDDKYGRGERPDVSVGQVDVSLLDPVGQSVHLVLQLHVLRVLLVHVDLVGNVVDVPMDVVDTQLKVLQPSKAETFF